MRRPFLVAFLLLCAFVVTGAIVPGARGAGTPDEALPDVWSGVWPSQLMEATGNTPLGTLTWRPLRYEDGLALVGHNFGGKPFTGCPADGKTRFFRGRYVEGGGLIACTRGDDATELVGRFDGREDFRSGSFEIKIMARGPNFFVGKYFEDGGITTNWCGTMTEALQLAPSPTAPVDITAPTLRLLKPKPLWSGKTAAFRVALREGSGPVRLDVSVLRGAKPLARMSFDSVPANGAAAHVVRWRVPKTARGPIRFCAAALDKAGNASARTCTRLTVR
jgi:hypothetical protein